MFKGGRITPEKLSAPLNKICHPCRICFCPRGRTDKRGGGRKRKREKLQIIEIEVEHPTKHLCIFGTLFAVIYSCSDEDYSLFFGAIWDKFALNLVLI
jgi:hypothetical protein